MQHEIKVHIYNFNYSCLRFLKSFNYLDNIAARMEARALGADEALILNHAGAVCSTSTANIFLVKKGRLLTPALDEGVLDGITRRAVLDLWKGDGGVVREQRVALPLLERADEIFITNTLMELMPVAEIDGRRFGRAVPGKITARLAGLYKELVKKETGV